MSEASKFLKLLNDYRQARGAAAVAIDDGLTAAAEAKARCFRRQGIEPIHHTCGGKTSKELRAEFGNAYSFGSEILAWSEATARDAFSAWRHSPVHNAVMLDPQYRYVGIHGPVDIGQYYGTWIVEFSAEPSSGAGDSEEPVQTMASNLAGSIASIPAPQRTGGKITRDMPIRLIGDVKANAIRGVLEYAKSPAMPEFDKVYSALAGHSVALTTIMAKETEYGRTANAKCNGWNTIDAAGGFTAYETWEQGAVAAARRFRDYTYKDGVYEPEITVAQFMQTWQGGPECRRTNYATCANGEDRDSIELAILQFCDRATRIIASNGVSVPPVTPPVTPPSGGTVTFGRVPKPRTWRNMILNPNINTAYVRVGMRIIRGIVYHRMLGSLSGTHDFFLSTAPYPYGAANAARTDIGIGRAHDGTAGAVYYWTPLDGDLAPHASGPANGIKGDARPLYDKFGPAAGIGTNWFNRDLASIEIAGMQNDAVSEADYKAIVEVSAWIADGLIRAPYLTWPEHEGLVRTLWHDEVTNDKACPFKVIKELTASIVADTAAYMKSFQLG